MATERYAGHIRVSDTASGNVVRHGRMGYKGVYGRMARPWFVKEETPHGIIRKRGCTCSAMHNNQCTTVNAVWCTERRVGVHKCLCIAYGTGKADVIGEPHNSKAHSLSRKAFLYETNVFCTK